MARIWTTVGTLSGVAPAYNAQIFCSDEIGSIYFFVDDSTSPTYFKVYSWDPISGFNDISGTTFPYDNEYSNLGLSYFQGRVYLLRHWVDGAGTINGADRHTEIWRHDSGQSWTKVFQGPTEVWKTATSGVVGYMQHDNWRLVAVWSTNNGGEVWDCYATDGTTWTRQTFAGQTPDQLGRPEVPRLLGNDAELNGNLGRVIATIYDGANSYAWQHSVDDDWQKINGLAANASYARLEGYAQGFSWWGPSSGASAMRHSTTWGNTVVASAGATPTHDNLRSRVAQLGNAPTETFFYNSNSADIWIYDQDTDTWSAETSTGGQTYLLTNLSNTLYAVVANVAAGEIYVKEAGELSAPPAEFRGLGLAADGANLYLAGNAAGTLKLYVVALESLAAILNRGFGAATYAELDSRARGVFPVVKPGADGIVWLRGRDGNDVQVQESQDAGASWSDVGDAGWAAAKYAAALLPDPLAPADLVAVFADDDLYRSRDQAASWTKTGDAPVVQREAARHPIDEFYLLLAGQGAGAGQLHFSPNYGATAADASDAAIGTVNAIEVAR